MRIPSMSLRLCVCVSARIHECMHACMDGWMDGGREGGRDGWMGVFVYISI